MRNFVRYFGLIFLQYMAVVAVFVVVVVLGCRYTPLSLFENYGYMLPSLGVWLTPMTLAGSQANTSLLIYYGVRRRRCFVCVQILAVAMSLCTIVMAMAGMEIIRRLVSDYDMEVTVWSLPVIFVASVAITELAFLVQYLPRGAGQRTASVLMVLIIISFAAAITVGVLKALDLPLPFFPVSVLRPGWLIFTVVCGLTAAAVGALCWRYFRKAVIRL